MELGMVEDFVELIRNEMRTRFDQLKIDRGSCYADEMWQIKYAPYYNDVCLAVLVAVRHQAEREMITIAAKSGLGGEGEVSWKDWNDKTRNMSVEAAVSQLGASQSDSWPAMQSLRFLTNSYKHDVWERPSRYLLTHLASELPDREIATDPKLYRPLSERSVLFEYLAVQLGLPSDSGILRIVSGYVEAVRKFLSDLDQDLPPVQMEPRFASMDPDSFLL